MAVAFFDTNVVLYSVSADPIKKARSLAVMAAGGVISVQVLNEAARVMRHKLKPQHDWTDVERALNDWKLLFRIVPVDLATHERGIQYGKRFGLVFWDSMMVAAATLAGCDLLYSEDMSDGQVIDGVTIRNPYAMP